jgi:hypothetical protein
MSKRERERKLICMHETLVYLLIIFRPFSCLLHLLLLMCARVKIELFFALLLFGLLMDRELSAN